MTQDVINRFLQRYEQPEPDPADPSLHMTVKDAEALQDALAETTDPLPLPDMDQDQRDGAAGKRFPEMQEVVFETAAALRRCPEVAQEIGMDPQVYEESARQDMSIGGFIKAMTTIAANADTGLLLAAGEGDALIEKTETAFKETVHNPDLDPDRRRALGFMFADALRIRAAALKDAQGQPALGPHPADAQQLQDQHNRNQRRQRVIQFLSDLSAGRTAFLSQGLAPTAQGGHTPTKGATP